MSDTSPGSVRRRYFVWAGAELFYVGETITTGWGPAKVVKMWRLRDCWKYQVEPQVYEPLRPWYYRTWRWLTTLGVRRRGQP